MDVNELAFQPGDRGIVVGASGSGKSTLSTKIMKLWQRDHCPQGRLLITDDKPRFRATRAATKKPVEARYRDYVKGDTINGVILDNMKNWSLVWSKDINPWQTVIVQNPKLSEDDIVKLCVEAVAKFFETQKPSRPSLAYIDEGLSFFGPTGNARHGNAIQRCFRAGREKNLSILLGTQRPKTINLQCLTECSRAYVFRLDYDQDLARLQEMSFPQDIEPLEEDHVFYFFNKNPSRKLYGPLTLKEG